MTAPHGKGMAAFLESVSRDEVWLVSRAGEIHRMSWSQYEALPDSSPLLACRTCMTHPQAIHARNRALGLQDAPTIWRN